MTRLTSADVSLPRERLARLDAQLLALTGGDLRALALGALGPGVGDVLSGARCAAVPLTAGGGVIGGFSEMVATTLSHLGCDAVAIAASDVAGMADAVRGGAEVLFLADDERFFALNLRVARCVDNASATAEGYVAALAAAAGGLVGRPVLLLGLGPVGLAAARQLVAAGAAVSVIEPDGERLAVALAELPMLRETTLAVGLPRARFVFDATPAAAIIGVGDVRPTLLAVVPGVPSAFSAGAQTCLGVRHLHDPLAIGVAFMAVRAFS